MNVAPMQRVSSNVIRSLKNITEKRAANAGKEKNRGMAVEMGIRRMANTMHRNAMEPTAPRMTSSFELRPLKGFPYRKDKSRSATIPRSKRQKAMSQTPKEGPRILIRPVRPVNISAEPNINAGPAMAPENVLEMVCRIETILFPPIISWMKAPR